MTWYSADQNPTLHCRNHWVVYATVMVLQLTSSVFQKHKIHNKISHMPVFLKFQLGNYSWSVAPSHSAICAWHFLRQMRRVSILTMLSLFNSHLPFLNLLLQLTSADFGKKFFAQVAGTKYRLESCVGYGLPYQIRNPYPL